MNWSHKDENVWQERRNIAAPLNRPGDHRDVFEIDRARIIHSAAFRRLQAKTQVLGISEGEFHRTRLTHSMEVAQVGRGIIHQLRYKHEKKYKFFPTDALIEAAGYAHDIGNPPFGHSGEIALNAFMFDHGGFEGNGMGLRILSRLESHTPGYGLDPTRRTLLSILKYPVSYKELQKTQKPNKDISKTQLNRKAWKPPKCYLESESDIVEWILVPFSQNDRNEFIKYDPPTQNQNGAPRWMAFDTSIMTLADDIAYGVHDLEDGVALRLITKDDWDEAAKTATRALKRRWNIAEVGSGLFSKSKYSGDNRKRAIGALVHSFVSSVRLQLARRFEHPLLQYNVGLDEDAGNFLQALKDLTSRRIVKLQTVQTLEYRGRLMILCILEAILSEPDRLLKESFARKHQSAKTKTDAMRIVCDYIACMRDEYAIRMYERLFIPRHGNVFERL